MLVFLLCGCGGGGQCGQFVVGATSPCVRCSAQCLVLGLCVCVCVEEEGSVDSLLWGRPAHACIVALNASCLFFCVCVEEEEEEEEEEDSVDSCYE